MQSTPTTHSMHTTPSLHDIHSPLTPSRRTSHSPPTLHLNTTTAEEASLLRSYQLHASPTLLASPTTRCCIPRRAAAPRTDLTENAQRQQMHDRAEQLCAVLALHPNCAVDGVFTDAPVLSCTPLHAVLARVWCALMLSQSLVVFCSDAHLLSDVMLSLRSLVAPLQPLHDFRPFFTVYDRDYAAIAAAAAAHTLPTPLLAGTNDPFVAETLGVAMDVLVVPAEPMEPTAPGESAEPASPTKQLLADHANSPFTTPADSAAGGVVEFTSVGALKRLVGGVAGCWYVEQEPLKPEAFLERFTADVEAILFRGNLEATTDAWSVKNTLLHGVLQTFTCNFLAPFRQCLEALYEEAVVPKHPYATVSEQLGEVDVWLVEDAVHRHPEWLKYPFRDGTATDFIYRFARTAQAEWLLAELRQRVRAELQTREEAWRERVSRDELMRVLPRGEQERYAILQRIHRVIQRTKGGIPPYLASHI
ncbi:hypothetical protein WA577_000499, partial [Blastocystis sp. JDR]